MTDYWCELAWLEDTPSFSGEVSAGVLVGVSGDRITSVVTGVAAPPPGATRLHGLTVPGLANAHSHAFQRALRGRTHRGQGTFWTWRDEMYRLAARLEPDTLHELARATFAEMLLAGYTTVGEFHYIHHAVGGKPYADPNAMGLALIDAAAAAGIRLTLLDTCYLHGGIGQELSPAQERFGDGDATAWAQRVEALLPSTGAVTRIGAAVHSVRAVDPPSIEVVARWARHRGAPLHAHVSEQPAENEQSIAAYRATPTQVLSTAGALGERFTAVHATHLTDRDIADLGAAACACCICPTTERDLADGVAPTVRLRAAGVRLSVGSDSQAVVDPWEEMRAIELGERLVSGRRGNHAPGELLAAAAVHGHAGLGWAEAGRIAPRALADLTTVSLDSVRLAATQAADAVASTVFAACAADVHHVVVGGRVMVREGRHVHIDVPQALAAAVEAAWA